ncbi:MAG: relaxase/mobilization nuclease domain-containing protein [Halothiobacillus sp.]|jgi:hypothetical protein
MKGMQKIKRGAGFQGALRYVFERQKGKEPGRLLGGNMSGKTPDVLAAEFNVARGLRPDIKKPVWHNSLRLPQGDRLTEAKWVEIADDYMERMGFSELHPRCYVLHDDVAGQHIHIVASRVGFDGVVYLGRNENLESTRQIALLEKFYGLTVTKGREYEPDGSVVKPERKKPKKGEIEKAFRTGVKPIRMQLQDALDQILTQAPMSASAFCEALEELGVSVIPNVSTTGKLNGFSFGLEGVVFSGSKLGDRYKLASLKRKGIVYEQARDHQILAYRKTVRGQHGGAATGDGLSPERLDPHAGNLDQSSIKNGSLVPSDVRDDRNGKQEPNNCEKERAALRALCGDSFTCRDDGRSSRGTRSTGRGGAMAEKSGRARGSDLRADMAKRNTPRTRDDAADRQSGRGISAPIIMEDMDGTTAPVHINQAGHPRHE